MLHTHLSSAAENWVAVSNWLRSNIWKMEILSLHDINHLKIKTITNLTLQNDVISRGSIQFTLRGLGSCRISPPQFVDECPNRQQILGIFSAFSRFVSFFSRVVLFVCIIVFMNTIK